MHVGTVRFPPDFTSVAYPIRNGSIPLRTAYYSAIQCPDGRILYSYIDATATPRTFYINWVADADTFLDNDDSVVHANSRALFIAFDGFDNMYVTISRIDNTLYLVLTYIPAGAVTGTTPIVHASVNWPGRPNTRAGAFHTFILTSNDSGETWTFLSRVTNPGVIRNASSQRWNQPSVIEQFNGGYLVAGVKTAPNTASTTFDFNQIYTSPDLLTWSDAAGYDWGGNPVGNTFEFGRSFGEDSAGNLIFFVQKSLGAGTGRNRWFSSPDGIGWSNYQTYNTISTADPTMAIRYAPDNRYAYLFNYTDADDGLTYLAALTVSRPGASGDAYPESAKIWRTLSSNPNVGPSPVDSNPGSWQLHRTYSLLDYSTGVYGRFYGTEPSVIPMGNRLWVSTGGKHLAAEIIIPQVTTGWYVANKGIVFGSSGGFG